MFSRVLFFNFLLFSRSLILQLNSLLGVTCFNFLQLWKSDVLLWMWAVGSMKFLFTEVCVCSTVSYGFFLEILHTLVSLLPLGREEMAWEHWMILDVWGVGRCAGFAHKHSFSRTDWNALSKKALQRALVQWNHLSLSVVCIKTVFCSQILVKEAILWTTNGKLSLLFIMARRMEYKISKWYDKNQF